MPLVDKNTPLEAPLRRFFADARERYNILLKRRAGAPPPWTDDPVMRGAYLCNVHREDDRVTTWFRDHVRSVYGRQPDVLLATAVFRWFTRCDVGEAIFCMPDLDNRTAFETLLGDEPWRTKKAIMRRAIKDHVGSGPYVTGAYIICGPQGMNKLDGVIDNIRGFLALNFDLDQQRRTDWRYIAESMLLSRDNDPMTLQTAHEMLRRVPYMGPFHAYEVVTDLRHTALLDRAPDVDIWANIGPGCRRGLRRVTGRECNDTEQCLKYMSKILMIARAGHEWPREWREWEMREVEHWLCEFDKIQRAREGGLGTLKRRYKKGEQA